MVTVAQKILKFTNQEQTSSWLLLNRQVAAYGLFLKQNYQKVKNLDIGFGKLGFAWFFLQKFFYQKKQEDLNEFFKIFNNCIDGLNSRNDPEQIFIECTELAYFIKQYEDLFIQQGHDTKKMIEMLEEVLVSYTEKQLERGCLDPYIGAFFPAYYFLYFSKNEALINKCIQCIDESKILGESGGYYIYNQQMGYSSLGIGHGLAFYIVFLASAAQKGIQTEKCLELIRGFVQYIEQSVYEVGKNLNFFPENIGKKTVTRLSLAYGDLGILFGLLKAASVLKDEHLWTTTIHKLKIASKRKSHKETFLEGNGLLYGRLGLSLFFKWVGEWTKEKVFRDTANYWYKEYEKRLYNNMISDLKPFENYTYKDMKIHSFQEGLSGILATNMALQTRQSHLRFLFHLL